MQRELGRLLNQTQESLFIDGGNGAIGGCHRRGATRQFIDECHFAEYSARFDLLDDGAPECDIDGSFDHREHAVRCCSLFEDGLTLPEGANVWFVTQDREGWHDMGMLLAYSLSK
jgi:hypothetical protein